MKKSFLKISSFNSFFFRKFLNFLDHPGRKKRNSPEKIVAQSLIDPGSTVLEVGCGSGFFTQAISKQAGLNGSVISIDIHPESVAAVNKKIIKYSLKNTKALSANAEKTKLKSDYIDTALIYGVIPSPFVSTEKVIKEMYRILCRNGKLAIWCGPFKLKTALIEKNSLFKLLKSENSVYIFKKC